MAIPTVLWSCSYGDTRIWWVPQPSPAPKWMLTVHICSNNFGFIRRKRQSPKVWSSDWLHMHSCAPLAVIMAWVWLRECVSVCVCVSAHVHACVSQSTTTVHFHTHTSVSPVSPADDLHCVCGDYCDQLEQTPPFGCHLAHLANLLLLFENFSAVRPSEIKAETY